MKKIFSLLALTVMSSLCAFTALDPITGDNITVWDDSTPSGIDVIAYADVGGVTTTSTLALSATYPKRPVAAINSSGQIAVIWSGTDPITYIPSIYAAVYDPLLNTWNASTLVSNPVTEFVTDDYQVKIANDGTVLITWTSYSLISSDVMMRYLLAPIYGTFGAPITL